MAAALGIQAVPLLAWFKLVNDSVTEPYLDEVFHVRQSQQYCAGVYDIWDPKITTPPGLYILSYGFLSAYSCSLTLLRSISPCCLTLLLGAVYWTYCVRRNSDRRDDNASHNALNVTLFPPLFFFSALYYTDVASTLSVVAFYCYFLYSHENAPRTVTRNVVLVLLGLASLLFRQTNIFWVAVFPAGIGLVHELDRGHQVVKDSVHRRVEGFGDTLLSVARTTWKMEVVYDPSVPDAAMEDYVMFLVSVTACGLKVATQPKRILDLLAALAPYLTLILIFTGFVLWNGGVVLGDKGNHIATLHLPQMLYIWPYITFFSWPLIYQYLLTIPFGLLAKLPQIAPLEPMLIFRRRVLLPGIWLIAGFVGIASVVVRFNTIVHSFTLADNRHYTFYVFRLLTQMWWMKYAVTPVYMLCSWACMKALGAQTTQNGSRATRSSSSKSSSEISGKSESMERPLSIPDGAEPAKTSFVLIWLATSALQLTTAPLVEPRYFILPWIFWRLHLPLQQPSGATGSSTKLGARLASLDRRLILETTWLLLVNAVTGYIFLKWEFSWPQEPGKVQRFMW